MTTRTRRSRRRRRGQALLRRLLTGMTIAVVLVGLAGHVTGRESIRLEAVEQPTATPLTAAYDETPASREITLEGETWYAIQTGVYSTREAAEARLNVYADRGAPGYMTQDDGKWRVLIACYGDKDDATAVRERLAEVQQVETYVHAWSCPEITLRLSGMAGQLDVAEAGLGLVMHTAVELREGAVALDAGESSVARTQAGLEALDERIALWADTARQRFAMPCPVLIEELLAFSGKWTEAFDQLSGSADASGLSANMKRQAMRFFEEAAGIRIRLTEK